MNGPFFSLTDLRRSVRIGEIQPVEAMEHYLSRISELNPQLNAFSYLDFDRARDAAHTLEATRSEQGRGALWGIPSADKDLVARAGMPTGHGSRIHRNDHEATSSDPMALWLDRVGAISVGKTSTSEFGMSGATEALVNGPTRNPHDLTRSAGGSSGGAACAVASGMLPFAPGSDGGGSIRIPALSCGVVGWKPSRGSVPASSGLDSPFGLAVAGLITRTASEMAEIWTSLLEGEWTWSTHTWAAEDEPRACLRIAVSTTSPWSGSFETSPTPEAMAALDAGVSALRELGHEVVAHPLVFDAGYPEDFLEVWSVAAGLLEVPVGEENLLEPLTLWLRERGQRTEATKFAKALMSQRRLEAHLIAQLSEIDVVVTPGLRIEPPALGWYDQSNPERNFAQQVEVSPWTSFVNVAGLPAVSLPTHYTPNGLPMGIQMVASPGADQKLISLACAIEARLPGATRWPAISAS